MDKGHYHMAKFFVGVSDEDNDQTTEDFDARPSNDPLARQTDLPMHWNWNSGYIFLRIDAMVDLDGDNTPETAMQYHLGKNSFRRDVSIALHKDVDADKQTLAFNFDVAKLFTRDRRKRALQYTHRRCSSYCTCFC
ncbi:MAG: MbnP family protein [Saprospiraceae bacterium]